MEELIRKVIATLDMVEVHGRVNMDRLLASVRALEKVADALKHNREQMEQIEEGVKNDGEDLG